MNYLFKPGDVCFLKSLPDWLIHDLPEDEKQQMIRAIGAVVNVESIDGYGYIWIGFGSIIEDSDGAKYFGHSFSVPPECVEKICESTGLKPE